MRSGRISPPILILLGASCFAGESVPAPVPAPAPAPAPAVPAPPAPPIAAPPPIEAVPDEAAQDKAAKELRTLYKSEFASRRNEDRVALARKLLEQGRLPGDAVSRFVMLRESSDLAVKAGEVETATSAVEALIASFRVDGDAERLRCLAGLAQNVANLDQAGAAISLAGTMADAAVQRDDYATALKAMAAADQTARRARDPGLAAQVRSQAEQIKALSDAWNQLGEIEDPLGGISPEGHAKLGRFHGLVKGDWKAALAHLAEGNDALRQVAKDEIAATTAPAQLAVADTWFDLAGKERAPAKQAMLAHSAGLYRMALEGLGGLDRARVDKRLTELDRLLGSSVRSATRRPPGAVLYLGFERDTLAMDAGRPVALDSSGRGLKTRITGAKPAIGAFGGALEFGPGNSSLDCGNGKDLAIIGSMTIGMWLKPTELGQRRNPFYKSYGSEGAITLEPSGELNYFYGAVGIDANPYQSFGNGSPLPVRAWSHIVLVRDLGPGRRLVWYFNGRRTSDVAATYPEAKASAKPFMIGFGYTGFPFIGLIDEVGVWARALSDAEVKAWHEATSAGR